MGVARRPVPGEGVVLEIEAGAAQHVVAPAGIGAAVVLDAAGVDRIVVAALDDLGGVAVLVHRKDVGREPLQVRPVQRRTASDAGDPPRPPYQTFSFCGAAAVCSNGPAAGREASRFFPK